MTGRANAFALLVAVVLSGCAAPQPGSVEVSSAPTTAVTDLPKAVGEIGHAERPVARDLGLNLTACQGSDSGAGVPSAWVQDYLPDGLETLGSPTNNVQIDIYMCGKVALDGLDVGPASFLFMRTPIVEPAGAPPGSHLGALYVLEFRTDNAAVAAWATTGLLQGAQASVVHGFEPAPDPAWWGTTNSEVHVDQAALYRVQAVPYKELQREERLYRWYFDTGPLTFWDVRTVSQHSRGDGEGVLEASEDSTFAAIAKGATEYPTLTADDNVEYRTLTPAQDPE